MKKAIIIGYDGCRSDVLTQVQKNNSAIGYLIENGASVVGGCCGTTPAHIRAIAEAIKGLDSRKLSSETDHSVDRTLKVSGLEAVEKTQIESAASLGMGRVLIMKEVIFPQALAVSVPAICANVIFLIKETSVVSGIALADLMYVTKDLIGLYYETDEALLMLVAAYLVILLPISVLSSIIERRLRYAGFGN